MDVIRHHDEGVDVDVRAMLRDALPAFQGDRTICARSYLAAGDPPKEAFPRVGAGGHEIRPGACVIIPAQTDGMAMVDVGVVFHCLAPLFLKFRRYSSISGVGSPISGVG